MSSENKVYKVIDSESISQEIRSSLKYTFSAQDIHKIRDLAVSLEEWKGTHMEKLAGDLLVSLSDYAFNKAVGTIRSYVIHINLFIRFAEKIMPQNNNGITDVTHELLSNYATQQSLNTSRSISNRYEGYNSITRLFETAMQKNRNLFPSSFSIPTYMGETPSSSIKTSEYTDEEYSIVKQVIYEHLKEMKQRLLVDGPELYSKGVFLNIDKLKKFNTWGKYREWYKEKPNVLLYLRNKGFDADRSDLNKPYSERRRNDPDLETWNLAELRSYLYPTVEDMIALVFAICIAEDGALNLSTILRLQTDCIREFKDDYQSTNRVQIVISKKRAGIDLAYHDVWDRGEWGVPSLIRLIMQITAPIRDQLDVNSKNTLIAYAAFLGVSTLDMNTVTKGAVLLADKFQKTHPDIIVPSLLMRKIRTTNITQVTDTNGLEAAKRLAHHGNFKQTIAYNVNPGNEKRISRTINNAQCKALTSIRTGFTQSKLPEDKLQQASVEVNLSEQSVSKIINGSRDTILAACTDKIEENEVSSCKTYGLCLSCPNAVVQERHLSNIISYRKSIINIANDLTAEEWVEKYENILYAADHVLNQFPTEIIQNLEKDTLASSAILDLTR